MDPLFEKKIGDVLTSHTDHKTAECLDVNAIGLYCEGKLVKKDKKHVEDHIQSCLHCLNQVTEMTELLSYQHEDIKLSPALEKRLKALFPKGVSSRLTIIDKLKDILTFHGWFLRYALVSAASVCLYVFISTAILKTGNGVTQTPHINLNSFVNIKAINSNGTIMSDAQGVLIDSNGLIASNLTPLAGASVIEIKLRNGKTYQTRKVWKDEDKNLAVMKIDDNNLPPMQISDVSQVSVGQSAFIVTEPGKRKGVNEAIVSALRPSNGKHNRTDVKYIQLATLTMQKNKGILVDKEGKLLGLLITEDKHINLAAPLNDAENLAKNTEAIPLIELKLNKSYGEAQNAYMRGILARDSKNWDDAIKHFKKCIELDPKLAGVHLELGYAYYKKQLYDLEAKEYEDALRLNPEDSDAMSMLASNLQTRGLYKEAIGFYEKAIAIDPEDGETLNELGLAYLAQGQKKNAMSVYVKLKKIDSGSAELLRKLRNCPVLR